MHRSSTRHQLILFQTSWCKFILETLTGTVNWIVICLGISIPTLFIFFKTIVYQHELFLFGGVLLQVCDPLLFLDDFVICCSGLVDVDAENWTLLFQLRSPEFEIWLIFFSIVSELICLKEFWAFDSNHVLASAVSERWRSQSPAILIWFVFDISTDDLIFRISFYFAHIYLPHFVRIMKILLSPVLKPLFLFLSLIFNFSIVDRLTFHHGLFQLTI